MHYLSKLLPALVLAASVNARVLDQRLVRRQNNADPLAAAMAAQGAQAGQGAAAPSFRCVCTPIDANAANAEAAAQFTANAATEDLAAAAGAAGEEADAGNATNPGVAAQDAAGAGAGAAGNPAVVAEMNKATAAAANSANAAAAGGNPGAGVNNAGAAAAGAGAAEMGVGGAAAGMAAGAGAGARAIYFQTNQVENAIMMIPVQSDGTLGAGSSIATGGQGGALIDMMTGQPAATDVLASQGAVRVLGNNLFAVNAGSNSLSMFAIDAQGMLTQVGQAVETGGDFPTSVAASQSLSQVCVGHTGAAAGITCATFSAETGLGTFDALRPFNLQQTNPPTGPLNGIGMTFFNEDSTQLITMVKGNPMDASGAFPGFVSSFAVANGAVATTDTQTTPQGTAVLFGTALIPGTNMVLTTDASFGSATLDLDNLAAPVAMTPLEGQAATCWATVSSATGTGFVTDVGANRLAEVDLQTGALVADLQSQNGNPGMIDLQAAGGMVYALAPGNGTTPAAVTVFDVSGGKGTAKEVQNFVVEGADNRAMGMAFASLD